MREQNSRHTSLIRCSSRIKVLMICEVVSLVVARGKDEDECVQLRQP
jgi:hypothetical protein